MTFQPRRAIVTASDSGIGRATAVALAAAGLDVGVTWHSDEAGAQETAAEVRGAPSHGGLAALMDGSARRELWRHARSNVLVVNPDAPGARNGRSDRADAELLRG